MTLTAINPADGSELGRFDELTTDQVTAAIERAHAAFLDWRERPLAERCDLLRSLAATLRANKDDLAREATLEMGKILREAEGEVEKSAAFCEYYADNAERLLAAEAIEDGGAVENYVRYEPLGAVARRHAVELPVRAGVPLRAADAGRRQRRPAQARLQRPGMRHEHRGASSSRPASPRGSSRRCSSARTRSRASSPTAGCAA